MNQSLISTMKTSKNVKVASPDQNSKVVDLSMKHLGIGIDTARYGHHVSFLREDKQPACPPMSMMESRVGYDQLKKKLEQLSSGLSLRMAGQLLSLRCAVLPHGSRDRPNNRRGSSTSSMKLSPQVFLS